MAARRPLYYVGGNLREMSSAMIDEVVAQVSYQYSLNPSVTLSVDTVNVSPNIGSIDDTRLIAGTTSSNATTWPDPPNTSTKTISISRTAQTIASVSPATVPSGFTRPMYWNGSALQVMTDQDIKDTFIYPAVLNLTSASTGTAQGGTYRIHTDTTLAGHTLVSANPVYEDTRADAALYNTVDETLDQPTTIQNYYLMRIDGAESSYTRPICNVTASDNFQTFVKTDFDTMLQEYIRYAVTNEAGYQITYNIGATGSGQIRGSGMTDTKLDSQVTRQNTASQADPNDYRAQDVPAGSPQTIATYYLRINQS